MPHALRTRFKKEIVAEFLPPSRPAKKQRVVIICNGAPNLPSRSALLEFFSKKGFWVVCPRYRGTWESDGVFLRRSPHEDILDIIDALPRGFESFGYTSKTKYRVRPDDIFLIASSFGGPAGILASRDVRVKKVIAISPVVDWHHLGKAEPLDTMESFLHNAFGNGYRFGPREWKKLAGGTFYNPVRHAAEIDGKKLWIFQARDDESVRWNEVAKFARVTDAKITLLKKGGHLGTGHVVKKYWPQIARFLKNN